MIQIGIVTYNRPHALLTLVNSLEVNDILNDSNISVAIFDDFSDARNSEINKMVAKRYSLPYVSTPKNLGNGYNKSNCLYYFFEHLNSNKNLVMLEDDVVVISPEFIHCWDKAINEYHHVNYLHSKYSEALDINIARVDDEKMLITEALTGQVMGFSRELFDKFGYFDPVFKKYGFAHTEYTYRAALSGYGGCIGDGYYMMKGYVRPNEIFNGNFEPIQYNKNGVSFSIKCNRNDFKRVTFDDVAKSLDEKDNLFNMHKLYE